MHRAITLFGLLLIGCTSTYEIPKPKLPERRVIPCTTVKLTNALRDEETLIRESLGIMLLDVQKSVTDAVVYRDNISGHFGELQKAHRCREPKSQICFLTQVEPITRADVWHEAGHCYETTLPNATIEEWNEIAGNVYGEKRYELKQSFPCKGLLTRYSSYSAREDIAEWMACIYSYIASRGNHNPFRWTQLADKRYIKKLDWLLKWGFISKEDYAAVKPLLE